MYLNLQSIRLRIHCGEQEQKNTKMYLHLEKPGTILVLNSDAIKERCLDLQRNFAGRKDRTQLSDLRAMVAEKNQ